jgi:hypothetical protein
MRMATGMAKTPAIATEYLSKDSLTQTLLVFGSFDSRTQAC